jgi:hypothetical protein
VWQVTMMMMMMGMMAWVVDVSCCCCLLVVASFAVLLKKTSLPLMRCDGQFFSWNQFGRFHSVFGKSTAIYCKEGILYSKLKLGLLTVDLPNKLTYFHSRSFFFVCCCALRLMAS